MSLWRPSGLQRCRACGKVAAPPSYVVFGMDSVGSVYHKACLIKCDSCDFGAPDEQAMRDHVRGFHPAPALRDDGGNEERPMLLAGTPRRVPLVEAELRAAQNAILNKLQALEPARPIEVQHVFSQERQSDWHAWTACSERGCGSVPVARRGILMSEVVFDIDGGTYEESVRIARPISGALREANVPSYAFSSGGTHEGVHVIVYMRLPEGCDAAGAARIRTAVFEHFAAAAGVWGDPRLDEGAVHWSTRHLLAAWAVHRKGVYTYMPIIQSRMPKTFEAPPTVSRWNPMILSEVQECVRPTREPAIGPRVILGAHRIDVRDERLSFVQDLLHPPAGFHDAALFRLVTMLRAFGLNEDEAAGFVMMKWKPENPCDTPGHSPGMMLGNVVRRIHHSGYAFNRSKTLALLVKMGKDPDRDLWRKVFYESELEVAEGEQRYREGCGKLEFVTCSSCHRDVALPARCRTPAMCPDCYQRKALTQALSYRESLMAGPIYMIAVDFGYTVTTHVEAVALERDIRMSVVASGEIIAKISNTNVVYAGVTPFTVKSMPATSVDFNQWVWAVVPRKSVLKTYINAGLPADEAKEAAAEWFDTTTGRNAVVEVGIVIEKATRPRLWFVFNWKKSVKRTIVAERRKGGLLCPYCSGPVYAPRYGGYDFTANLPRDPRRFREALGSGPPD